MCTLSNIDSLKIICTARLDNTPRVHTNTWKWLPLSLGNTRKRTRLPVMCPCLVHCLVHCLPSILTLNSSHFCTAKGCWLKYMYWPSGWDGDCPCSCSSLCCCSCFFNFRFNFFFWFLERGALGCCCCTEKLSLRHWLMDCWIHHSRVPYNKSGVEDHVPILVGRLLYVFIPISNECMCAYLLTETARSCTH